MDHPPEGSRAPDPRPAAPDADADQADELRRVEKAAALACLHLTADEARGLGRDLARIVDHFRSLGAVDVEGIEPMLGASRESDVTRPDDAAPGLPRAQVLACAPDARDGFYSVPKTIGGKS